MRLLRQLALCTPATKQVDGRMQPQVLPSSLTVTPRVHGLEHTAKTLAMPSSSTLHYAIRQLDDTVINSHTQPFTQQLNASPAARQHNDPILVITAIFDSTPTHTTTRLIAHDIPLRHTNARDPSRSILQRGSHATVKSLVSGWFAHPREV